MKMMKRIRMIMGMIMIMVEIIIKIRIIKIELREMLEEKKVKIV